VAAVGTLIILPALITALKEHLFQRESVQGVTCNCVASVITSVAVVVLLALSYQSYYGTGWTPPAVICAVGIPIVVMVTAFICRRRACRRAEQETNESPE
jgi:Na+/melibiose symporter-like transporter